MGIPSLVWPQRRWARLALVGLMAVLVVGMVGVTQAANLRQAVQAYLFGYPLVIMDLTRAHHLARTGKPNALSLARQFPTAQFKEVVRPNLDTLYATAFLDTRLGPWQLDLPPNAKRYELVTFLDAWSDVFAAAGTRTHGHLGQRLWVVDPNWQGSVPQGVRLLRAPSRMVWVIGRIQTLGIDDLPTVHALQDQWVLSSLGAGAASIAPSPATEMASPVQVDVSPLAQMEAMGTQDFYRRLAALMADNPPRPGDADMVRQLQSFGVEAGKTPSMGLWDRALLSFGRWLTMRSIYRELGKPSNLVNGWRVSPPGLGQLGVDYPTRAAAALVGLGANLAQDTLYAQTQQDGNGQALDGSRRYRIRFEAGQWPPVNAFWSVTAYDGHGFLLDHPSQRHLVRSSDPFQAHADGSLELWVQPDPPPHPYTANWVPVVSGQAFTLNLRLYGPQAPALSKAWSPPPIQPGNATP